MSLSERAFDRLHELDEEMRAVTCRGCGEIIDADEPECPYCQEPRDQEEKR